MDLNPSFDKVPFEMNPSLEPRTLNIPLRQSQLHSAAPTFCLAPEDSIVRTHRSLCLKPIDRLPIATDSVLPLDN